MGGESCSLGGDEFSMDLMVVQRRLGFLEASLTRSRLDAANDVVINRYQAKKTGHGVHRVWLETLQIV